MAKAAEVTARKALLKVAYPDLVRDLQSISSIHFLGKSQGLVERTVTATDGSKYTFLEPVTLPRSVTEANRLRKAVRDMVNDLP
jgi:hypothetical protein